MQWIDIQQMDDANLKAKVIELRKELMGLRFQRVTGQVEKTHSFCVARRTIARIKTLLNQRALALTSPQAGARQKKKAVKKEKELS